MIDKRLIIAPPGTFKGVATNLPYARVQRASDGTLYIKASNGRIYSSRDQGLTWDSWPIDLKKSLAALGVDPQHISQGYGPFGIVSRDRFILIHHPYHNAGSALYASISDDLGRTWTTHAIDFDAIRPAGAPKDFKYPIHYASGGPVFELSDVTLCAGVAFYASPDWTNDWPPKAPTGEGLIRSKDRGVTWGDANYVHLPDPFVFECDYAQNPSNPDIILATIRHQRPILPDEDAKKIQSVVGFPDKSKFVYKNGELYYSHDAGRSFHLKKGGTLGWYQHRNGLVWTKPGIVAVTHKAGPDEKGAVLVRISVDHGQTWFDGDAIGNTHFNTDTVKAFVLHASDSLGDGQNHNALGMSTTIALDDTHFFTTIGGFLNAGGGIDTAELHGVIWHVEGSLVH